MSGKISQIVPGLDRSHIDAGGKIEHPPESPKFSRNDIAFGDLDEEGGRGMENQSVDDPELMSKRKRLSSKTKKALHIGGDSAPKITATAPVLADAPDTISNSRLVHELPKQEHHKFKELLHNPVDAVTSAVTGQGGQQVASNLVAKEISHGQEVELVQAQDEVLNAKTDDAEALAIEEVDMLVKRRQDMFVRWTMDRHVTKVRILPQEIVSKKGPQEYLILSGDGKASTDWIPYLQYWIKRYAEQYGGEYIGATCDPPAPSKEVLMPSIERLLVASAPLQTLIMTARHIYRWENRKETGIYLAAYTFLWIFDLILPGMLLSMLYLLIHRKVAAPNIEDLRKDIERTEGVTQVAMTLSEFIQKKGDEDWLDPLLQELGPWALVQLSDLANFMEVLRNFYEWRVPSRTGATAALLATSILGIALTPTWLFIRATTLTLGIVFFGLFPIGSYYPDYRYLASPLKWMFWKIPTHAEWSIKALQDEGAQHRSSNAPTAPPSPPAADPHGYRGPPTTTTIARKPLPPMPPSEVAYGSYDSKLGAQFGMLILTASGIRFESSIGHKTQLQLRYEEIGRLEKVTRHVQKALSKTASGEDLRIVQSGVRGDGDEGEWVLENVKDRDQAFSQIVGFSRVTWQVVW